MTKLTELPIPLDVKAGEELKRMLVTYLKDGLEWHYLVHAEDAAHAIEQTKDAEEDIEIIDVFELVKITPAPPSIDTDH